MKYYEPEIETVTLIPSHSGRYEITVNDTLIYSKLATHRHAEAGEVSKLVKQYIEAGKK